MKFDEAYMMQFEPRAKRADNEDSFLLAFGNKHGSDRRKQRRARKGWDN